MKQLNRLITSILILINFNDLAANQVTLDTGSSPLVTNITNNNNYHTTTLTLEFDLTQMSKKMLDACENSKKLAAQKYQDLNMWLKSHKYIFIGAGAAGLYSIVIYQLSLGKKILNNPANWANWHHDTNLTELINKPTNLICRELHQAILDKYSSAQQPDALTPIILFNCDLNQEIKTLKFFCVINQNLNNLRLQTIFLTSDHELELAKDKLNRLIYLKKVINESIQISLNR